MSPDNVTIPVDPGTAVSRSPREDAVRYFHQRLDFLRGGASRFLDFRFVSIRAIDDGRPGRESLGVGILTLAPNGDVVSGRGNQAFQDRGWDSAGNGGVDTVELSLSIGEGDRGRRYLKGELVALSWGGGIRHLDFSLHPTGVLYGFSDDDTAERELYSLVLNDRELG